MAQAKTDYPATLSLEEMLNSMRFGVMAVDRELRITYCNKRCGRLFHRPVDQMISKNLGDIFPDEEMSWVAADHMLKGEREDAARLLRLSQEDEELSFRVNATIVKTRKKEPVGTLLLIDEWREEDSDYEFQEYMNRLVSLGELSACVAHEIRNPLTGVRTTVQFVQSKLAGEDATRGDLEDIIKELDRVEQIITDLLLFARPQKGKPVKTDLHNVLEKVIDNLSYQISSSNIRVEKKFNPDLPSVKIDSDLIQQVFLNIVLNAVQAMPDGGDLLISSGLRKWRTRRTVEVSIADSGPGVPDEHLPRLFDPFFTTRSMGTGLGLSISQQIVSQYGGNIRAKNNPKGGAVFTLRIPLREAKAREARQK
jgi:signal transduction histidine kinase